MTGQVRVSACGLRWVLTTAGRELISDNDLDLSSHLAAGRATLVKHGEHRTVYRVALPYSADVYWKHCRLNGPRAWWRDFLRGPKAWLEFVRLAALADRGVDTIQPLAWARFPGRWPRGSFVITRALEGAVPLDHFLVHTPPATPVERRQFTVALAAFVARLHSVGIFHPDLHPGNLLIRPADRRLFLIDIHDVELGGPMDQATRRRNLVILNRWFQLRSTPSDRLRFYRAYSDSKTNRAEARRIERDTGRSIVALWRSRDGRCRRENRQFRPVRGHGVNGFAIRELEPDLATRFASDPDAPFTWNDVEVLKSSRSSTVCTIIIPTVDGPRQMIYKRFQVTHRSDFLATFFRLPPALRSWMSGHAMIDRQLPTPRPWLVLHRHRFGVPGVGYLLCERMTGSRHLHEAMRAATRTEQVRLTEVVARWIRLMHERGVSHRDLKAANVLVTPAGDCQFIDLVGTRTHRRVPETVRVRDLGRLSASFVAAPHVSNADRLRFLRIYLEWGLHGRGNWKVWWNRVAVATRAKIRRNELSGRPLT